MPSISPNVDAIETLDGVRYVLNTSNSGSSNLSLAMAFVLRVPVLAAVLAIWFLWQHVGQVSPLLTCVSGLFVAQMLFAARLPWILFRRALWQQLIARFGQGEIELRRDRLCLGNRVGKLWSGTQRNVNDIHRLVVYVYEDGATSATQQPADTPESAPLVERVALAVETNAKAPWLLVDGLERSETLALAENLQQRLSTVAERHSAIRPLPPPVVVETQQSVLYPPVAPDFYRRRQPWWLAVHLAGSVGLGTISTIAVQTGAWQMSATNVPIILAWMLEALLLVATVAVSRTAAAEPPQR